jgi:hypothetical protein
MYDDLADRFTAPTAIISASSASSRERAGFIDQPTTLPAKNR